MATMQITTQTDYLKDNADNIWFVLGAYFFAFFPWMIMHNIDFISEKWRTCRRTRRLAHIHIASSIFPILYVAVYAEAQRRDQDNKELGAALAALMFNVFQLMRTMMGYVQVSAFVAWCKYAEECIRVLQGDDHQNSVITEGRCRDEARTMMEKLGKWYNVFLSWCQCGWLRVRRFVAREGANGERRRKRDEGEYHDADADADTELNEEVTGQSVESIGVSREGATESNGQRCFARTEEDDGDGIEDIIMVNNMVVDNELGGKEVTVLPSWKKILRGLKQGKFTPSKWLQTDQVILSTVRWGGAYLCSMGEGWSAHKSHSRYRYGGDAETMESFFSSEMCHIRKLLQHVEWNMYTGNDRHEYIRILPLSRQDTLERTREFSTAYGNLDFKYVISDNTTVEAYSFEFNSLVSSYPGTGDRSRKANRERVGVGLVHSVLLAQHFGVEKLKALRRYYDRYRVPQYTLRNAFELLISSIIFGISRDHLIWNLFGGLNYQIPVFPYRMQMVALWEEATNWRVLQASAHQDIFISDNWGDELQERVLENALYDYHIFDYCAEWAADLLDEGLLPVRCSAGLVMETVRTFFAEWITASVEDPNWEPDMPKECVEFKTAETIGSKDFRNMTWICQRELQRKVAKKPKGEENFVGEPALIMLLIIGFPILHVECLQDVGVCSQAREGTAPSNPGMHRCVDLNVHVWRVWSILSPQDISLIIRSDSKKRTVSLTLQNDSSDARFMWQDWVNAVLGFMQGYEIHDDGTYRYGRKIVEAELSNPIVKLCPLIVNEDGMEPVVERTGTARVWTGWPAFDIRICKFEVEQWLDACNIDVRNWVPGKGEKSIDDVIDSVQEVLEAMVIESENL